MLNKFSIFFKLGGGHGTFVRDALLGVSKAFDRLSTGEYVTPGIHFHIEVRVDGDVVSYDDAEGCFHLRYTKPKELIAITIAIRENVVGHETVFKRHLSDAVIAAFQQMIDRLVKENYQVDEVNLIADLSAELDQL